MNRLIFVPLVLGFSMVLACSSKVDNSGAVSDPVVVENVSSATLTHGNSFTVGGSGFGEKASAAPVVWDDVEGGSFHSTWQSSGGLSVLTAGDHQRHARSGFCGTANMMGDGGVEHAYFTGPNSVLGEFWFVQYWFKMDENFDWGTGGWKPGWELDKDYAVNDEVRSEFTVWRSVTEHMATNDNRPPSANWTELGTYDASLANVKLFRMWNPGSALENFVLATVGYGGGSLQYNTERVSNSGGAQYFGDIYDWAKDVWHLFQFEYRESTIGENDGVFRWWIDGVLTSDNSGLMTREEDPELKRPFIVGFYNSWGDGGTDRDDFYIDDIYIDNTWSRVEICPGSTWSERGICETQVPVAWGDEQIEVEANQGDLASGETVYLYVVDAEGTVNDSGYGLSFN